MSKERLERFFVQLFIVVIFACSYGVALVEPFLQARQTPYLQDGFSPRTLFFYPFSSYPMFSDLFEPTELTFLEIRAVSKDDEERVLSIERDFFPYWEAGLRESLQNQVRAGKEPEVFFRSLLRMQPSIQRIRVYLVRQTWGEWLRARSQRKRARTTVRDVLLEVQRPRG